MSRLLEVIACSAHDAVEAERGGAGRIELVRNLELGGMTPPRDLVREVLTAVAIPVRVMLRETSSHQVDHPCDRLRLHETARELASLPVDGLVFGFLRDGEIDVELTESVLAAAGRLTATFHHAFESARDPWRAIADLKRISGIDRILTYGGKDGRFRDYQKAAAPDIVLLAGGGLDAPSMEHLAATTDVREFHCGRAARDTSGAVAAECVVRLVEALERT